MTFLVLWTGSSENREMQNRQHRMQKPRAAEELGPLRVIYPRDQFEELQDQRFDHRWVWMLREIVVNP